MMRSTPFGSERGATLVVSLIMLTLLTMLVSSAFMASNTGLKSVGNMQSRDESVAAANKAIEQVLSSPFTNAPKEEAINVDIDNDSQVDYEVVFAKPTCVSAQKVAPSGSIPPSSGTLGPAFAIATSDYFQTLWDIDANVTDPASGTSVRVREGVRILLNQVQYNAVCSS